MRIKPGDYAIHNAMEEIADKAIQQVLSEDRTACDCPLCREDIKSQMLNQVQPLYHPIIPDEPSPEPVPLDRLGTELFNKVMVECYKALIRVKENNRHTGERAELHNAAEDLLRYAVSEVLSAKEQSLDRDDLSRVMATAINGLKPSYTTTNRGDAFIRACGIDPAYLAKVYSQIFKALEELSIRS